MRRVTLLGTWLAAAVLGCGDDAAVDSGDVAVDSGDAAVDSGDAAVGADVAEVVSCDAPGLDVLRLTTDGTALRDALGRRVVLRGVNAGGRAKFPPYVPFAFDEDGASGAGAPPFDEALAAYLDRLRAWGLNVVRMPFTWEAVEPVRGTYDEVFLGRLDAMIDAAGARGIRVVLDFHQDVFAQRYCGDGFPEWALGDPDAPSPEDCSRWFLGYFQNADVQRDFDRFWDNDDGLRDAFEALWTMLAERYGERDAVVGFEIMNEPGWGTRAPDVFTREVLTPFYERMVDVVRQAAPAALVFVDATGLDGVNAETALERPARDGIVFAPHYYDGLALAGVAAGDEARAREMLAKWAAVGEAWRVPVLVGEFGAPRTIPNAAAFMRAHWEALEQLGLHGTEWEYSVTGESWNAETLSVVESDGSEREVAAELVRAYPVAVAGALTAWSFDRSTGEVAMALAADGVTVIAAPARLYPGGPEVTEAQTSTHACIRWDAAREVLIVGARGRVELRFQPR